MCPFFQYKGLSSRIYTSKYQLELNPTVLDAWQFDTCSGWCPSQNHTRVTYASGLVNISGSITGIMATKQDQFMPYKFQVSVNRWVYCLLSFVLFGLIFMFIVFNWYFFLTGNDRKLLHCVVVQYTSKSDDWVEFYPEIFICMKCVYVSWIGQFNFTKTDFSFTEYS